MKARYQSDLVTAALVEYLLCVLGAVLTAPHVTLMILPVPGCISFDHQQPLAKLKTSPSNSFFTWLPNPTDLVFHPTLLAAPMLVPPHPSGPLNARETQGMDVFSGYIIPYVMSSEPKALFSNSIYLLPNYTP